MLRITLVCMCISAFCIGQLGAQPYIDPAVLEDIERYGVSRAIVDLREPDADLDTSAAVYLDTVLSDDLEGIAAIDQRSAVAKLTQSAVEQLSTDPFVDMVLKDEADPPTVLDTTELMHVPPVWEVGHVGSGFVIAVLDTGVEADHPFLRDKIVHQACFSVEDSTLGTEPLCPAGAQVGAGDVVDLTETAATGCPAAVRGCDHGTHVAGIAAGGAMDDPDDASRKIAGVARGANIVAIQVFSKFTRNEDCRGVAPCVKSFRSSQRRALQYVHSLVLKFSSTGDGLRISAVNMSLGAGRHSAPCDAISPLTSRIRGLRQDGVATFVASGNDGFFDGVGHPACVSDAITVGAIDKSGNFAQFTNRFDGTLVDLLAVGAGKNHLDRNDGVRSSVTGGVFNKKSGTSMATPAVAGAFTVLKSAFPDATVDEIENALEATGTPVPDPLRTDLTFPAVDLEKAVRMLSESEEATPTADAASPAGDATAEAAAEPRGSSATGTRFNIETLGGRAGEVETALEDLSDALAEAIGAGTVDSSRIDADALVVRTDKPVTTEAIEKGIRDVIGADVRVSVDRADPLIDPVGQSQQD